ncbi:GntR family transcriptional regulator [Brevibacillus fulvus]|uniref:GntR family transcriptional regulator n=1 Tax=Brevibacillus fulvus TaxID=1125967 RepID=UPI001EF85695|nr:GntR family transcriptional regulator [Brevibacillus fulvus]
MLEITVHLQKHAEIPLYLQLYQYLKQEIHSGRITPGTRLPSIRASASHLASARSRSNWPISNCWLRAMWKVVSEAAIFPWNWQQNCWTAVQRIGRACETRSKRRQPSRSCMISSYRHLIPPNFR